MLQSKHILGTTISALNLVLDEDDRATHQLQTAPQQARGGDASDRLPSLLKEGHTNSSRKLEATP